MTHDELVDLGMLIAEVRRLTDEVQALRAEVKTLKTATDTAFHAAQKVNKLVHRLSCMEEDTDPDCPVAIHDTEPPSHRASLASMSDEEPDSVLTRPVSVHAGKLSFRGPGIMVAIIAILMGFGGLVALALTHKFPHLF